MSMIDSYNEYVRRMNQLVPNSLALKIRRVLTVVFLILVAADVLFVLLKPFPTISQVILDSSPRFMILIWLFGIVTFNLFFPLNSPLLKLPRLIKVLILFSFGFLLTHAGNKLAEFDSVSEVYSPVLKNLIVNRCTEVLNGEVYRVECLNVTKSESFKQRIDLHTNSKLSLFLVGIISGIFLSPQILKNEY